MVGIISIRIELRHGLWTPNESFYSNIPNILAAWAGWPNKFRVFWVALSAQIVSLYPYSHLSNKRGGWNNCGRGCKKCKITKCGGGNKRGGGKTYLINVEGATYLLYCSYQTLFSGFQNFECTFTFKMYNMYKTIWFRGGC